MPKIRANTTIQKLIEVMYELQVVDFVFGTETCLYKAHMYTVTNGGDYWNENVSVWLE